MSSNDNHDERQRMGARISDWEHIPPQLQQEAAWDWRTVDMEVLDPVTTRMVVKYRQRAAELGIALEEAPDDPFVLFDPPHDPYPSG